MSESTSPTREDPPATSKRGEDFDNEDFDTVVIAFASRVERLQREMQGLRQQLEQIVAQRGGSVAAGSASR